MKVLMYALGTRGDVQPYIALALELESRGHEAIIAAPSMFDSFVSGYGVRFAGLDDGPMRLLGGSEVGNAMGDGLGAKVALARKMTGLFDVLLEDVWAVASEGAGEGADVIVHNGQVLAGQHIAEKLGIPAVLALPIPMYVPTGAFPWPGQSLPAGLPALMNRLSYLGMQAPVLTFGRAVDRWRERTLGLSRRKGRHDPLRMPDGSHTPVLHAISPQVLPQPNDWPEVVSNTGYWFLPSPERQQARPLPEGLDRFLEDGEPPVFVGFGSMVGGDPRRTTRIVVEAAQKAGVRVVLGSGWGGLDISNLPDDVFVVGEAPYEKLFPRVRAIVHHGGSGTIGVSVAAGRPQIVCPFVADQPFWAKRMHSLGVASFPLPQRKLTADGLARAIGDVIGNDEMKTRAQELGELVRSENGIGVAAGALDSLRPAGQ